MTRRLAAPGRALTLGAGVPMDQAYLEFSRDGLRQMVALDADRLSLGRASGNDPRFPADDTFSGQHTAVKRQPDGWAIRDLGSSNGTYINGQRLSGPRLSGSRTLDSGDEVSLGQTRLVFRLMRSDQGPPATPPVAGGYLDLTGEWGTHDRGPAWIAGTGPDPLEVVDLVRGHRVHGHF